MREGWATSRQPARARGGGGVVNGPNDPGPITGPGSSALSARAPASSRAAASPRAAFSTAAATAVVASVLKTLGTM